MLRKLATLTVGAALVVVLALFVSTLFPDAHAQADQNFQQAAKQLSGTEQKLAATVSRGQQAASEITGQISASPDAEQAAKLVSKQLKELEARNSDLEAAKQQLSLDIQAFETARAAKMAEFDREIESVADVLLKRQMQRLRDRARRESGKALAAARAAHTELAAVLEQGSDLQHVSKCIRLGGEIDRGMGDLRSQVQQVRTFAAEYSQRTQALLATLSQGSIETASSAAAAE